MANKNLNAAKTAKKDEFYTQLTDIERELQHYWPHFRNKVVLCNCDDPYESNFFKYFALRFNQLGLKKLICTCYDGSPVVGTELSLFALDARGEQKKVAYKVEITEVTDVNGDGTVDLADVEYLIQNDKNVLSALQGNGDFRSRECIELLKQADIVVTNPPFSLFREYLGQLIEFGKKFLIIGHQNAITYKEVFPLLQSDKVWLGYGFKGGATHFSSPYDDIATAGDHRENMIRVSGVNWFTNLEIPKRNEELDLVCKYSQEKYPHYDNYNAINVGKTQDIPYDYEGIMGVPITFLDKYNPHQFEIVWQASGNTRASAPSAVLKEIGYKIHREDRGGCGVVNGKRQYSRILIRNKHPKQL
ncbi:MAG: adenine-specific methyltransferase EcoRI family protein [Prevotella sp.]|nr:adenine-specific methyltransferase EcoRI family protein [Prevotella sp.]